MIKTVASSNSELVVEPLDELGLARLERRLVPGSIGVQQVEIGRERFFSIRCRLADAIAGPPDFPLRVGQFCLMLAHAHTLARASADSSNTPYDPGYSPRGGPASIF